MRSPTAADLVLFGLVVLVSSLLSWALLIAYEARYEIFEAVVTVGSFVTDFPYGTLTTITFIGALLLYVGLVASLES